MTTLGYGDMSPKSHWGQLISILCVAVGLIALTFLINIIGECFEEVFREYIEGKSKRMELEHPAYVQKYLKRANTTLTELQTGQSSKRRWFRKKPKDKKHKHATNNATTKGKDPKGLLYDTEGQAIQATNDHPNGEEGRRRSMEIRRGRNASTGGHTLHLTTEAAGFVSWDDPDESRENDSYQQDSVMAKRSQRDPAPNDNEISESKPEETFLNPPGPSPPFTASNDSHSLGGPEIQLTATGTKTTPVIQF